jgi:hypothetical protein
MKPQRKITSSEKKLFLVTVIALAFIVGFGAWWQWVNALPDVEIPTPKLPSPNAYDFYVRAGAAIVPIYPTPARGRDRAIVPQTQLETQYSTEKKEAWLNQNSKSLKLLRQGFKYPCRVPPSRSFSIDTSKTIASLRSLARMLAVESRCKSERNKWGEAANSALDILYLGRDIPQGGMILDFLNGAAVDAIGRRELWKILPHLDVKESKLAARRLDKIIQSRVNFADVIRGEKYWGQNGLLEVLRRSKSPVTSRSTSTGLAKFSELWRSATTPRRVLFKNYTTYMDAVIANAEKPYAAKQPEPPMPDDFYTELLAPSYERGRWNYARAESGNALILVALALRAFQLDHKTYPQKLQQLVPNYLQKIPADPFGGGEALRYRRVGREYSLYSIGPDGIDNRGRAIEDTKISKERRGRFLVQPNSKGDIVAGVN